MSKEYSYLFRSDDIFNSKLVDTQFEKRGNWHKVDKSHPTTIDFLYDGYVDNTDFYGIKSILKNWTNDDKRVITNKLNMYENMKNLPGAHKYLPKTFVIDIKHKNPNYLDKFKYLFTSGKPYICKAVAAGAGTHIINTNNFAICFDHDMEYNLWKKEITK